MHSWSLAFTTILDIQKDLSDENKTNALYTLSRFAEVSSCDLHASFLFATSGSSQQCLASLPQESQSPSGLSLSLLVILWGTLLILSWDVFFQTSCWFMPTPGGLSGSFGIHSGTVFKEQRSWYLPS